MEPITASRDTRIDRQLDRAESKSESAELSTTGVGILISRENRDQLRQFGVILPSRIGSNAVESALVSAAPIQNITTDEILAFLRVQLSKASDHIRKLMNSIESGEGVRSSLADAKIAIEQFKNDDLVWSDGGRPKGEKIESALQKAFNELPEGAAKDKVGQQLAFVRDKLHNKRGDYTISKEQVQKMVGELEEAASVSSNDKEVKLAELKSAMNKREEMIAFCSELIKSMNSSVMDIIRNMGR